MAGSLLGVVHLAATPSAGGGGAERFQRVLDGALRDAESWTAAGADGLMVENFGDAPFHRGSGGDPVPPDVPAALAVAARAIAARTGLEVGVNCLRNDGRAAIGAAVVAGARWVRVNVLAGAYVTDQGVIEGEAATLAAYRRLVGAEVDVLADLLVKHAEPLAALDPIVGALDLVERGGASGVILTGNRTGTGVDTRLVDQAVAAVGAKRVWIGSGLDATTAGELTRHVGGGAIVGTAAKEGGRVGNPVDRERAAAIVSGWRS